MTSAAVGHSAACRARWRSRRFEQQNEKREAREAEQPDGDAGDLDRLEERDPVQRQHRAVGGEAPVERACGPALAREVQQERERDGGDRAASEDDRDRRQREPLAEQPGETEQRDRAMQRGECARWLPPSWRL